MDRLRSRSPPDREISQRGSLHTVLLAVDTGHVRLVVALADGRREVVKPVDLIAAEFNAAGGRRPGPGNRADIAALGEQPGQSDLWRGSARLGGDGLHLIDDAQVEPE